MKSFLKSDGVLFSILMAGAVVSVLFMGCEKTTRATAENNNGNVVVKARPNSKVKVDAEKYDFGVMELGTSQTHTFTLTSIGDEPLEIKRGTTTCKCTLSGITAGGKKVGKDGTLVLKKGESAAIELEWTPEAHNPSFSQEATIHTSDPDRPTVDLQISGQVDAILTLAPPFRWLMGAIDGERIGTTSGTLTSKIVKSFSITEITCADGKLIDQWALWDGTEFRRFTCADGDFLVESTPVATEKLNQQPQILSGHNFVVHVLPSNSVGQFKKKLAIKTDVRSGLVFRPEVSGVRTGPFMIRALPGTRWANNSMRLMLGRFPANKGGKAELLLYVGGLGKQELKITRIDADSQDVKVELKPNDLQGSGGKEQPDSPGRRKSYRLLISVRAGANPVTRTGMQAATVKLLTNHKRVRSMTIGVVYDSY